MATRPITAQHLANIIATCKEVPPDARMSVIRVHQNGAIIIEYDVQEFGPIHYGWAHKEIKLLSLSNGFTTTI
jgi:hypothetical protein